MFNSTTYNVNGLNKQHKGIAIFNFLKETLKAGIYLLQETHSTPADVQKWYLDWGNKNILFDHGLSNARGTAILFHNINYEKLSEYSSGDGRLQITALNIIDINKKVLLINIYNPNTEKDQVILLKKLENKLSDFPNILDFEIICGGILTAP